MTAKFKGLTDRQQAVVETMRMRLTERQAMAYLASDAIGFPMSERTLYREKRKLNNLKFQRLALIAASGFQDQHVERIDNLEMIQKLMWQNYHQCTNAYQRVIILEKIKEMQPYLSTYYDATREVMERNVKPTTESAERKETGNISMVSERDSSTWV